MIMKIAVYSTNSNYFDMKTFFTKTIPSCKDEWKNISAKFSNVEFNIVTQKPGFFLADDEDFKTDDEVAAGTSDKTAPECPAETEKDFAPSVKFYSCEELSTEKLALFIKSLNPDLAVAASFWCPPYDWLCVKDSLVGEALRKYGIKVICHSVKTASICFDKYLTKQKLEAHNFNTAPYVFVSHELFVKGRHDIKENVYREAVLHEIEKLKFPVVIKDTNGLSSYGTDVAKTFGEAKNILLSKKNNGDRIVEEYISGLQFGLEMFCNEKNVKVENPFLFSVNQYGITSPKQSVKAGPVKETQFKIKKLKKEMKRLAKVFKLNGIAQVDLVYSEKKWYVLEINPRLSGMSGTYGAAKNKTLLEYFLDGILNPELTKKKSKNLSRENAVLNIKLPLIKNDLKCDLMDSLYKWHCVKYLRQMENICARQERERGYCEIVFAAENFDSIMKSLCALKEKEPSLVEENFYAKAVELVNIIQSS